MSESSSARQDGAPVTGLKTPPEIPGEPGIRQTAVEALVSGRPPEEPGEESGACGNGERGQDPQDDGSAVKIVGGEVLVRADCAACGDPTDVFAPAIEGGAEFFCAACWRTKLERSAARDDARRARSQSATTKSKEDEDSGEARCES